MSWKPVKEAHAIERVSLTLILREQLASKPLTTILNIIQQKAAAIGINEIVHPTAMPFPIFPPELMKAFQPQFSNLPSLGKIFRKTNNGVVEEEITCNGNVLTFAASVYDRWQPFLDRVEQCFSEAVSAISPFADISELRVEYWDRFDLPKPDSENPALSTVGLVNPDSQLLAAFHSRVSGPMHAHVGYFKQDGNDKRILVNANVDVLANVSGMPVILDPSLAAQAKIYTLAATQFTTPEGNYDSWHSIKATATDRHNFLKDILGDIIHPALATSINLNCNRFEI